MALIGALCQTLLAATGFTNKHLRVLMAGLLGSNYRPGQMTYDLRRLRLTGLIHRLPPTNPKPHPNYAKHCAPSTTTSTTTSTTPASHQPPKNLTYVKNSATKLI
jgi:hypothetical protein